MTTPTVQTNPDHEAPHGGTWLATVQAAEQIGIERSTLSRWVKEGRITPAFRLPGAKGAMIFAPDEVERVAQDYAHQANTT